MDNTIASASELQTKLNTADATTDLKALAQEAISVLAQREEELAEAESGDLQSQLDEALKTIDELGQKLDFQEQTKSQPGLAVTLPDGTNKLLIGGKFNIPGFGKFTAQQVAARQDILAHLVKIGSGTLVDAANGSTSSNTAS